MKSFVEVDRDKSRVTVRITPESEDDLRALGSVNSLTYGLAPGSKTYSIQLSDHKAGHKKL